MTQEQDYNWRKLDAGLHAALDSDATEFSVFVMFAEPASEELLTQLEEEHGIQLASAVGRKSVSATINAEQLLALSNIDEVTQIAGSALARPTAGPSLSPGGPRVGPGGPRVGRPHPRIAPTDPDEKGRQ